jgi:hypothetical protein
MARFADRTQKAGSACGAKAPARRKAKRGTETGQGKGKGRATGAKKGSKQLEQSETTAEGGVELFKEALERELKSSSDTLAKKLVKEAGKGHIQTLRYVVTLAEQHEAKEPDRGPYRSQALAWAMEPPWEGPPPVLVDRDGQILRDEDGEIMHLAREVSQEDK